MRAAGKLTAHEAARRKLTRYWRSRSATGWCGPGSSFDFGGLPIFRRRPPNASEVCALGQNSVAGRLVGRGRGTGRLSLFLWRHGRRLQMTARQVLWRTGCALVLAGTLLGALYAQRPFREYPSVEYGESVPLPRDWHRPAEWVFARLMYPPGPLDGYRGDSMATGGRGSLFGPRITRRRIAHLRGGQAFDPGRRPIGRAGREPRRWR